MSGFVTSALGMVDTSGFGTRDQVEMAGFEMRMREVVNRMCQEPEIGMESPWNWGTWLKYSSGLGVHRPSCLENELWSCLR